MQIKHLKEFYNVDTISQDKGWKRVHEAIGELTEDLSLGSALNLSTLLKNLIYI